MGHRTQFLGQREAAQQDRQGLANLIAPLEGFHRRRVLWRRPRCDRYDRQGRRRWRGCACGDPFSASADRCGSAALPGYFATTFAALPLPRNGANIDIITPPPTARQPEQIANAVGETSNCSGEPGTVSP